MLLLFINVSWFSKESFICVCARVYIYILYKYTAENDIQVNRYFFIPIWYNWLTVPCVNSFSHSDVAEVPSNIFGSFCQWLVNCKYFYFFLGYWLVSSSKRRQSSFWNCDFFGIQILLVEISMLFMKKSCQLILNKFGFKKLKKK